MKRNEMRINDAMKNIEQTSPEEKFSVSEKIDSNDAAVIEHTASDENQDVAGNVFCIITLVVSGVVFAPFSSLILICGGVWGLAEWSSGKSPDDHSLGRSVFIGCVLGLIYPISMAMNMP